MSIEGWIANVILIAGLWFVGSQKWWAFLLTIVGEVVWVGIAIGREQWDLAVICAIFGALAAINLIRWRNKPEPELILQDELDEWARKHPTFSIEIVGAAFPFRKAKSAGIGDAITVTVSSAGRDVVVRDHDEDIVSRYYPVDRTAGNLLLHAVTRQWDSDSTLKRYRVRLTQPPAALAVAGSVWTPQEPFCEICAIDELALIFVVHKAYEDAGREPPRDFPIYEIGPA